jgi:hypothetical protein
LGLGLFNS